MSLPLLYHICSYYLKYQDLTFLRWNLSLQKSNVIWYYYLISLSKYLEPLDESWMLCILWWFNTHLYAICWTNKILVNHRWFFWAHVFTGNNLFFGIEKQFTFTICICISNLPVATILYQVTCTNFTCFTCV